MIFLIDISYELRVSVNLCELLWGTEITCLGYLPILRNEESISSRSFTNTTFDDYFVNGYKSGKTKLWDLWSGSCLRVFEKANIAPSNKNIFSRVYHHRKNRRFTIYSVCSFGLENTPFGPILCVDIPLKLVFSIGAIIFRYPPPSDRTVGLLVSVLPVEYFGF